MRRAALQCLYQFDSSADIGDDVVRESLYESPGTEADHDEGLRLARQAWAIHTQADAIATEHAEDWPTRRQPIVDRSILRLAYCEMALGRTPPKVAINEAVELAKEFSTEQSPMFINGILDKMYRLMRETGALEGTPTVASETVTPTD
jgi:N utilization substance protein B